MRDVAALIRRVRPHRGIMLLALVVFSATSYIACGGDDRVFGNGGSDTSTDVVDDDTATDSPADSPADTIDDSPSTND